MLAICATVLGAFAFAIIVRGKSLSKQSPSFVNPVSSGILVARAWRFSWGASPCRQDLLKCVAVGTAFAIQENAQIFDFSLSPSHMDAIDSLRNADVAQKFCWNPATVQ